MLGALFCKSKPGKLCKYSHQMFTLLYYFYCSPRGQTTAHWPQDGSNHHADQGKNTHKQSQDSWLGARDSWGPAGDREKEGGRAVGGENDPTALEMQPLPWAAHNYPWVYSRREKNGPRWARGEFSPAAPSLLTRKSKLNYTLTLFASRHGLEYVMLLLLSVLSVLLITMSTSRDHRLCPVQCCIRGPAWCAAQEGTGSEWSSNLSKAAELAGGGAEMWAWVF